MSAMKYSGRYFAIGLVTAWYSSNIGVLLFNKVQLMKISALNLIFCASVVSGNISLKYLPVSFNQAIGATIPFFTAVFAYVMTKIESWLTYATLFPMVTGVIIASGGEPSFHLFGFLMCVGATAARALKFVVQGILLSSGGEKLNSMNLLLYMAPIAVVLLLPATLVMEENVVGITLALAREDIRIIWFLLFNFAFAYFILASMLDYYCAHDEDFVADKDDGGSPIDDSGGESDTSKSIEENEKPKKEIYAPRASSKKKIRTVKMMDHGRVNNRRRKIIMRQRGLSAPSCSSVKRKERTSRRAIPEFPSQM
ncbi:hypothetical protein ACS0TY_035578 [Phlomoides rotata]